MNENEFSVYWYTATEPPEQIEELRFVSAEEAMKRAIDLIRPKRPINVLGGISRLIVTDGEDFCVFEWLKDQGIVFPPECVNMMRKEPT